ncbi:MAG TPA: AAA family ATPase [Kofleriaceae bacterium]|nr:AAA family ATPase [Kofleriaceae bacterium]
MAHAFPGFRVVEQVYASGRSVVERAVRLADTALVVVKQASGDVVTAEAVRRAQHEYELLTALRGAGVVDVHALVRDGSHVALILESCGDVLATAIADHRLSVRDVLDAGIQIARSMARMHAAGIVHRDINPRNIVYDPASQTAKLIDFDIAVRARPGRGEPAAPTTLEGTLHYMAPEQTGRLNRAVDHRADLYALGITLYELFSGRRPFDGDDALAIVHAHLAEQPRRLDEVAAVPGVIADIVMKLIAKAPEQRYQTAGGLQADLERCRQDIDEHGRIAPFAIGRHDAGTRFEFSDRLYGRQAEIRALLDAFARVSRGGVETVLVSGYSGIGKSSLVREVHAPVMAQHGYVAAGKFDRLNRDLPYSALVAALGGLVAQILAEPAIDRWRAAIAAALGDDAPFVRSVVPAIERVLGAQPPPPAVDAVTAHHRLALGLSRLVQVFARRQHPLVVFLDDMQWADRASLQLLTQLATSDDTEALLVIETYRENEVDPAHPFALAVRDQEKHAARLSRIALGPLGQQATLELIADTLRLPPDQIADAAGLIWRKTDGNPFFIREFLQALYDEGYVAFDPGARAFRFDVAAIERAGITENVADLLAHKLGKLSAATRELLLTAAAIGNQFDVETLAIVAGRSPVALHELLAPAVDAGMIAPLAGTGAGRTATRYRFQHDRIQQAAYEASPVDARDQLHLRIGRQLLSSCDPDQLEVRLFDIVHHLNRASALIEEEPERARFVELAVVAARRARRSGAFDVAATWLSSAGALRDPHTHYAAWFAARLELAEVLSLGGRHEDARHIVRATSEMATPRDLAALEALDTTICISLGLMAEALACGRRAAALFDLPIPSDPAEVGRMIEAEVAIIMAACAEQPIEQWIDLPVAVDPDQLALMALLSNCLPAAYQIEPPLLVLLSAKLVTLSLRHGNCGASARGYSCMPVLMWTMGQYDAGFRFGKLGVDVVRKLGAHAFEPVCEFAFSVFSVPWQRPIEGSVERLRKLVTCSLELGDIAHAGYSGALLVMFRQLHGAPLRDLLDEARRYHKLCARLGLVELEAMIGWYIWHARWWTGGPPAPGETEIDYAATERALVAANGSQSLLGMFRILELERRYWRGELAGVVAAYQAIVPSLVALPGQAYNAEVRFYYCLAAIAHGDTGAAFDAARSELARYAAGCPANWGHMATLVDAELARKRGDAAGAMQLYDAAIDAAAENGFIKVEAIAHQLAAQFWSELGKPAFAVVHLGKARDVCEHWGARSHARELELRRRALGAVSDPNPTARSVTAVSSTLDFATVAKASQAIASDIVLDRLLAKIMDIIIENTGAQAGSIVLQTDGELLVHASKQPGAGVAVSSGTALADAREVSEGIIKYVMRTAECVVLGDATRHPTFRTDPYVRERRPRSVLCLPIVHQERMIGAVYLENNLVADAFTVDRLEALGILVAQLAISIENAMMFSRLEDLVAERTRELTEANQQLREHAAARERMESQLRLAQKLQSVGQLAAGIAHEINTPMQYIGNSIAFLKDAVDSLLGLVDAYHASIDRANERIDAAALAQADDEFDLRFLRANAPAACTLAVDGVARVSRIVSAMKAFSHPDHTEQAATALNAAIENTLVVAHNEYRDLADIVVELGDIPHVVCHIGELNQVFLNLIVNAAHAIGDVRRQTGERGTITIRTLREDDDTVLVTVSDTGGGIPEAIRERVFDPFFTTKDVGRGTGQGLALARTAIVDRHGGSISFESRPGAGTTFFVRLPIHGRAVAAAS